MDSQNTTHTTQTIIVKKTKSDMPMIFGIIGFLLGIPAVLCATVCAAACAGVTSLAIDANGGSTGASVSTGGAIMLPMILFILCWVGCFVLSFFGKGERSKLTGIITIVAGFVMGVVCLIMANILGVIAASLYIVSGCLAFFNASKPAE